MKKPVNRIERKGHPRRRVLLGGIAVIGIAIAAIWGYRQLRELWLEQCVVSNFAEQVEISNGKLIKSGVLAEYFGLREGVNLADIDFAAKREATLKAIPSIRTITVTRHLPGRVSIVAEEREPIARVNFHRVSGESGRVVDSEGVVFCCRRGTRMLPTIREASAPGTPVGAHLAGRAAAALELVETCRESDFQSFGLLEVDITPSDYLLVTLGGNYATVKLAWDGMDNPATPESHANLIRQLTHLRKAMDSGVAAGARVWNATDTSKPGRIYADMKGSL